MNPPQRVLIWCPTPPAGGDADRLAALCRRPAAAATADAPPAFTLLAGPAAPADPAAIATCTAAHDLVYVPTAGDLAGLQRPDCRRTPVVAHADALTAEQCRRWAGWGATLLFTSDARRREAVRQRVPFHRTRLASQFADRVAVLQRLLATRAPGSPPPEATVLPASRRVLYLAQSSRVRQLDLPVLRQLGYAVFDPSEPETAWDCALPEAVASRLHEGALKGRDWDDEASAFVHGHFATAVCDATRGAWARLLRQFRGCAILRLHAARMPWDARGFRRRGLGHDFWQFQHRLWIVRSHAACEPPVRLPLLKNRTLDFPGDSPAAFAQSWERLFREQAMREEALLGLAPVESFAPPTWEAPREHPAGTPGWDELTRLRDLSPAVAAPTPVPMPMPVPAMEPAPAAVEAVAPAFTPPAPAPAPLTRKGKLKAALKRFVPHPLKPLARLPLRAARRASRALLQVRQGLQSLRPLPLPPPPEVRFERRPHQVDAPPEPERVFAPAVIEDRTYFRAPPPAPRNLGRLLPPTPRPLGVSELRAMLSAGPCRVLDPLGRLDPNLRIGELPAGDLCVAWSDLRFERGETHLLHPLSASREAMLWSQLARRVVFTSESDRLLAIDRYHLDPARTEVQPALAVLDAFAPEPAATPHELSAAEQLLRRLPASYLLVAHAPGCGAHLEWLREALQGLEHRGLRLPPVVRIPPLGGGTCELPDRWDACREAFDWVEGETLWTLPAPTPVERRALIRQATALIDPRRGAGWTARDLATAREVKTPAATLDAPLLHAQWGDATAQGSWLPADPVSLANWLTPLLAGGTTAGLRLRAG